MKKRNLIILIFSIILIHCAYPSKEMEEKKYIEIANQRKDTSSSSKVISAKILETDGNFEKYASGIIYDKSANLEWVIGPDKAMSWESARVWVKNLKIDIDHGVWRLPTLNELKTLYKKGRGLIICRHFLKCLDPQHGQMYKNISVMLEIRTVNFSRFHLNSSTMGMQVIAVLSMILKNGKNRFYIYLD